MEVKLVQSLKQKFPILVTLSGIDREVKCSHPVNAPASIFSTLPGITIDFKFLQP